MLTSSPHGLALLDPFRSTKSLLVRVHVAITMVNSSPEMSRLATRKVTLSARGPGLLSIIINRGGCGG